MTDVDLRTAEDINVDNSWSVRVAEQSDSGYEAAVVAVHKSSLSLLKGLKVDFNDEGEWKSLSSEPRVTADSKYLAVGKAIEAHRNDESEGESASAAHSDASQRGTPDLADDAPDFTPDKGSNEDDEVAEESESVGIDVKSPEEAEAATAEDEAAPEPRDFSDEDTTSAVTEHDEETLGAGPEEALEANTDAEDLFPEEEADDAPEDDDAELNASPDDPFEEFEDLTEIKGLAAGGLTALRAGGFETLDDVRRASETEISFVDGIGGTLSERIAERTADIGTPDDSDDLEESDPDDDDDVEVPGEWLEDDQDEGVEESAADGGVETADVTDSDLEELTGPEGHTPQNVTNTLDEAEVDADDVVEELEESDDEHDAGEMVREDADQDSTAAGQTQVHEPATEEDAAEEGGDEDADSERNQGAPEGPSATLEELREGDTVEVPEHLTESLIEDAVDEYRTVSEVAIVLECERETMWFILYQMGYYHELESPEGRPEKYQNAQMGGEYKEPDAYEVVDRSALPLRIDLPDLLEACEANDTVEEVARELDADGNAIETVLWKLDLKAQNMAVLRSDGLQERIDELWEVV